MKPDERISSSNQHPTGGQRVFRSVSEKVTVGVLVAVLSAAILAFPFKWFAGWVMTQLQPRREIPLGAVIAFPNKLTAPPEGYEFCDGEFVTTRNSPMLGKRKPDLNGRFLRGAPKDAAAFVQGGKASLQLAPDNLPPHSHELPLPQTRDNIERHTNYERSYLGEGRGSTPASTRPFGSAVPIAIEPPFQDVHWIIRVL